MGERGWLPPAARVERSQRKWLEDWACRASNSPADRGLPHQAVNDVCAPPWNGGPTVEDDFRFAGTPSLSGMEQEVGGARKQPPDAADDDRHARQVPPLSQKTVRLWKTAVRCSQVFLEDDQGRRGVGVPAVWPGVGVRNSATPERAAVVEAHGDGACTSGFTGENPAVS